MRLGDDIRVDEGEHVKGLLGLQTIWLCFDLPNTATFSVLGTYRDQPTPATTDQY